MSDREFDRRSLLKLGAAAPLFGVDGVEHRLRQDGEDGSEDGTDGSDGDTDTDGSSDGGESTDEGWTQAGHDAGRTFADPDDRGPTVDTVLQWRGNDFGVRYSGELPVGDFVIADGVLYSTDAPNGSNGSAVDARTAELIWVADERDRYANVPKRDDYRRVEPLLGREPDGSLEQPVFRPVVSSGVLATVFQGQRTKDREGVSQRTDVAHGVVARDAETGEGLWKEPVDIDTTPSVPESVSWLTATGETLLVSGQEETVSAQDQFGNDIVSRFGKLIALDITTGETRWVREFGSFEEPTEISPAVANDEAAFVTVGFGIDNRDERPEATYSLDLADGSTRWQSSINEREEDGNTYGNNAFYGAAIRDGTLYVPSRGSEITAVEADDGSRKWRITDAATDPRTFAVSTDGLYAIKDGSLVSYDLSDGTEQWQVSKSGASATSNPVVAGGIVYGPGIGLIAYDAETGEQLWQETRYGLGSRNPAPGGGIDPTFGYGGPYQIADGAIYTEQGRVSRYVTPPARIITEPVIAVAGRERSVGVTLQNTSDGPLPGITVEATAATDDGPLSDVTVSGVPDELGPNEETTVDVSFTVAQRTEGAATIQFTAAGEGTTTDRETLSVEVQRPFSLTARFPEAASRAVAGRPASLGLRVEGNDRLDVEDVAVEVRLDGFDGEWAIENRQALRSDGAAFEVYPDAGAWENLSDPGTNPEWRLDRLPPEGLQFPKAGLIPPDALPPGSYTLTVAGYEQADTGRTLVDSVETEFDLDQVYATVDFDPPVEALDEGESGTIDLRIEVLDDDLDGVRATAGSLPSGVTAVEGTAAGGTYEQDGGGPTWSWGATDALTTLEGSLTVRVEQGTETGAVGGTFDVPLEVTGPVAGRDQTVDATAIATLSVLGLDRYRQQKVGLAGTLNEWSGGTIDERTAVTERVDEIVGAVRSGGLDFEPGRMALERLVYGEQVAKRALRVTAGFDDGGGDLAFTYELAPRTATKGITALGMAVLGHGAGKAVGGAVQRVAPGAARAVTGLVSQLVSRVRGAIESAFVSLFGLGGARRATAKRLLYESQDEALPDATDSLGASSRVTGFVEDVFSPVIDFVAEQLLTALRVQDRLNTQLEVTDPATLDDGLPGDQLAAKSARRGGIDELTADAQTVDALVREASELPFGEIGAAVGDALAVSEPSVDEGIELVTRLTDALVRLFELLRNLAVGTGAAAGFGISGILMLGGNYRRGVDGIVNGTRPSFNV